MLLVVLLPLVHFDDPKNDLQQTVGLVELSPEELSRLQGVIPQQAPLPSSATQQSQLPPMPSFPALQSDVLPPLPPPPSFLPPPPPSNAPIYQYPPSNFPPQPQIPVQVPLPPPPSNQSVISPSEPNQNLRVRDLSPLPPNAIPPNQNLPSTTGIKPGEPFSPTANQPNSIPQQNTNQTQNQIAINNRANQQTPRLAPSTLPERTKQELIARRNAISQERLATKRTVTPDSERSQRLAALQQRLRQQGDRTNINPAIPPNSDRSQRLAALQQRLRQQGDRTNINPAIPPNSDRSQRLAALQQRLRQQGDRTASSPATVTPQSDSNQRLAAALQRQQQNPVSPPSQLSVAATQTIAQLDAFKEIQQAYPTAVIQPPIRYKIKTCKKQLDGSVAVLTAVVSPEGKIISGPDLLSKQTPVPVQQSAVAFVNKYQFPKTSNQTNQPFRLEFTYDSSCPVTTKQQDNS